MTTQTTIQTRKSSTTKGANKAAQTASIPFFAALLADALSGKFGPAAKQYYASANAYHAKQKTVFPRPKTEAARKELTIARVKEVIELATKGILSAGLRDGQAVYDLMKTSADKSAVKAK